MGWASLGNEGGEIGGDGATGEEDARRKTGKMRKRESRVASISAET